MMRRRRASRPRPPGRDREHVEQCQLVEWARVQALDPAWSKLRYLFAVPNGGFRSSRTAGRMKAEGLVAGVSDLVLPVPCQEWHGLFLELKAATRARERHRACTAAQLAWLEGVAAEGFGAFVVFGVDAARGVLAYWLGHRDPAWGRVVWEHYNRGVYLIHPLEGTRCA